MGYVGVEIKVYDDGRFTTVRHEDEDDFGTVGQVLAEVLAMIRGAMTDSVWIALAEAVRNLDDWGDIDYLDRSPEIAKAFDEWIVSTRKMLRLATDGKR